MLAASRHRKLFLTALIALLALFVPVACGDDDSDAVGQGAGSESGADDEGGEVEPDEADTTTTTDATTTTTTTQPPRRSGAECVIGTWQNDNEAWGETFMAIVPADAPVELESVTGTTTIDFRTDGTSTTVYEDWTISMRVTQPEGSGTITRNGVDHGTYQAGDDGSLTVTDTEVNSVVDTAFTIGGQTMAMPGIQGEEAQVIGGAGTYDCDGDRMSISVEGQGMVWMDRVG